jgi:tight adherence protein B
VRRAPPLVDVAAVTHRLAVLLAAGLAPASAWGFVAEASQSPVPVAVAGAHDIPEAIVAAAAMRAPLERQAWTGLAAAWAVASDAGAPLASTLRDHAASLRDLVDAQRDAAVALAAPRATGRVVLALPAVGVVFGALMGFGTLGVLFATPVGWACLAIGGALVAAAQAWTRRLVASAEPVDATPGLECDLMAIAVSGGASVDRSRAMVDRAMVRSGCARSGRVEAVLDLSRRAGVPAAELLRAEAAEARRDARAAAQHAAAALSVRLMLPLGVCILPAFIVLGVVPLLIAVLSSTVESF